ncbi:MAG: heme biosynthesis HemY N-terminal domain-containing protein [Lysobacteraceae bacterium]
MSLFRQLLILLALAAIGAWLWHLLAADPGYVLVAIRGWSVETTVVVAVIALILAWLALRLLLWLLRTPFDVWRRQRRRVARERLAGGLLALEEGRWKQADRLLAKAASDNTLRIPALLAAGRAAFARDEPARAASLLAEASMAGGELPARLVEAEHLLASGQAERAANLLEAAAGRGELCPRGLELLARALLAAGRPADAMTHLPALHRSHIREGEAMADLEAEIIAPALRAAADEAELATHWNSLARAQRLRPDLTDAYSARAAELGLADAASDAIVKAMKKDWSELLARRFGLVIHTDRPSAIRLAERWLAGHEDSAGLHLSLGRLCQREQLWGKAESHLQKALALNGDAETWEAIAQYHVARDDDARARQAYANALRAARGESVQPVRRIARADAQEVIAEQRSSMGVPLLPSAND